MTPTDGDQLINAAETTIPSTTTVIKANATAMNSIPTQGNKMAPISTPIPLSREGWRTFTSTILEATMEYPPDWSVSEESNSVTFSSTDGATIVFALSDAIANNDEIIVGNRRCAPRTNAYNLTADVCIETISFSYSASFTLTYTDGSTKWLMMNTITRATIGVFDAMFDSIHQ